MLLPDIVGVNAGKEPGRPAVVDGDSGGRAISHAEPVVLLRPGCVRAPIDPLAFK